MDWHAESSIHSTISRPNANKRPCASGTVQRQCLTKGYNKGRWIKLKDTDINALVNAPDHKYIRNAVAVKYIDSAKVSTQRDYISNGLQGVFPQTMRLSGVDMYRGRFINETDIREMRKVTVLSKKSAETLFGDADNAIGQRVTSLGLS